MAKQSNLEKIGLERRNEHELIRNDIKKNKPYGVDHELAQWHEGDENHPLGKGTNSGGHQHSLPQEYNELTRNQIKPQIDTENGGGSYDINGRAGVDGGRRWLQTINLYNKENQYGINSIDTEANIEDGQVYIK
jgi:hypothetical protein